MGQTYQISVKTVAASLLLTVILQIAYLAALADVGIVEGWPLRSAIWTIELLLFSIIAVTAFVALIRANQMQLAWSAIAMFGLVNVIQAGIGLSMFLPATEAGDDFAPLMETVLAGAFVFYFLAKVLIGFATISFGLLLLKGQTGLSKAVGAISSLAGLAALGLNIAALPTALTLVIPAGASGTLATLLLGLILWFNTGGDEAISK